MTVFLKKGTQIGGGHQIIKVLGKGGFGITYLAQKNGQYRALKEYFPHELCQRDPKSDNVIPLPAHIDAFNLAKEAFYNEAQILKNISQNPHLIHVYEAFRKNNTIYCSMEYIDGVPLTEVSDKLNININKEKAAKALMRLAYDISTALIEVHQAGIVHLDIKPANIMIKKSDRRAVLIDFGAAKYRANSTEDYTMYSMQFAPIEQIKLRNINKGTAPKIDSWSDIFSLCMTLYILGSNVRPPNIVERLNSIKTTGRDNYIPFANQITDQASLNLIPKAFIETIDRGLAINPNDRPKNAEIFLKSTNLSHFQTAFANSRMQRATSMQTESERHKHDKPNPKRAYQMILLTLLVIALGLLGIIIYFASLNQGWFS